MDAKITHEKKFLTQEIATTKNFGPTKYARRHDGTTALNTRETHDDTLPTKFSKLNYYFVNKNKDVWRFLAANTESDTFTNSIYATKDYTYHNLRGMILVKHDRNSSIVTMKKSNYVTKLDNMIGDGIMKDTYIETTDNVLKELSRFQDLDT